MRAGVICRNGRDIDSLVCLRQVFGIVRYVQSCFPEHIEPVSEKVPESYGRQSDIFVSLIVDFQTELDYRAVKVHSYGHRVGVSERYRCLCPAGHGQPFAAFLEFGPGLGEVTGVDIFLLFHIEDFMVD